jgi:hypothetical protein
VRNPAHPAKPLNPVRWAKKGKWMIRNYYQIWIAIPTYDFHETIYSSKIGDGLYLNEEIPFITNKINYRDVMVCGKEENGKIFFIQIAKTSGYTTIHTMFSREVEHSQKTEIIKELLDLGVHFRRSGLLAFSFSIDPGEKSIMASNRINRLMEENIITPDNREIIGPIVQAETGLHFLLGKKTNLHNGLYNDPEMNYFPNS